MTNSKEPKKHATSIIVGVSIRSNWPSCNVGGGIGLESCSGTPLWSAGPRRGNKPNSNGYRVRTMFRVLTPTSCLSRMGLGPIHIGHCENQCDATPLSLFE